MILISDLLSGLFGWVGQLLAAIAAFLSAFFGGVVI
jgi:hypothetical protein